MSDLKSISPLLACALTGLLVMALDLLTGRGRKGFLAWVTAGGFAVAGGLAFALWREPVALQYPFLSGVFVLDAHGGFFAGVVLLTGALAALLSADHNPEQGIDGGEAYSLLAFSVLGAVLLVVATDLITLFLGLEIMSLALYVMAAGKRASPFSAEAGLKYFLLGGVASAVLLMGVAFLYGVTGSLELSAITRSLVAGGTGADPALAQAGVVLLVVALGFKVAAVPFHFWTPDVYEGAPTPVTAFMAGAVKAAAFAVMARLVLTLASTPVIASMQPAPRDLLLGLSVLSMIVGNVLGIVQTNVKRILAYSSIAHAGYVLLGLWAAQPHDTVAGLATLNDAVPFYLLAYAVATVGAFGALALLTRDGEEDLSLDKVAGLGRRHPGIAFVLMVSVLSLAGIPPLGGFLAKFNLFRQVLATGPAGALPWVVLAIVMSVVALYYYLRILLVAYFRESGDKPAAAVRSPAAVVALVVTVVLTLVLGTVPGPFLAASRAAAQATVVGTDARASTALQQAADGQVPAAAPGVPGGRMLAPGLRGTAGGAARGAAPVMPSPRDRSRLDVTSPSGVPGPASRMDAATIRSLRAFPRDLARDPNAPRPAPAQAPDATAPR